MKKNLPVVIIGNGGAAVHAIMAMREKRYQGEIHLFSDHESAAYNPMLTSYFVAGKIDEAKCFPFGNNLDFYSKNNVKVYSNSPVVKLDAEKQTVITKNGFSLSYSKCLVVTGASSFVPSIPGVESKCVFGLRTMQDAVAIKEALKKNPRKALVVGASMTGIKLAEIFLSQGLEVCMADMQEHIFPTLAYPECSELVEKYLVQKGVKFRFGAGIQGIEESDEGVEAYFSDGNEGEKADIIVIAIGVRPNLQFIDPFQVVLDKGIVVDETMKSSCVNLYAAGDVAQGTNLLNGKKEIIGLWGNARYQGRTAGRNMAGVYDAWPGNIPHNISHFFDLNFVSIGDIQQSGEVITMYDPEKFVFHRVVRKDGKVVGLNLLNCYLMSGMLKKYFVKKEVDIKGKVNIEDFFDLQFR